MGQLDTSGGRYDVMVGKALMPLDGAYACLITGNERICVSMADGTWRSQRLDLSTLDAGHVHTTTDFPAGSIRECFIEFHGRLLFFYSWWDRDGKVEWLGAREVDAATGGLGREVYSTAFHGRLRGYLATTGVLKMEKLGKYAFMLDDDRSQLHIGVEPKSPAEEQRYLVLTLDSALNEVESPPITEAPRPEDVHLLASELLPDWSTVVVARTELQKRKGPRGRKVETSRYMLMRLGAGDAQWQSSEIITDHLRISSGMVFHDRDGIPQFAGWYRSPGDWPTEQGFLRFKDHASVGTLRVPFPDSLLLRCPLPKEQQRVKFGAANVVDSAKHVVFVDVLVNDSVQLLIAEQRYTDPQGNTWETPVLTTNTDDIFLCALSERGQVLWIGRIPRWQARKGSFERTFHHLYFNRHHHFFRFDRLGNLRLPLACEPMTTGPRVLVTDRFDHLTGAHSREFVADPDSWGITDIGLPHPDRMRTIGDDRVLLMCETGSGNEVPVMIRLKPE